jgi:hypothetical protein
LRLSPRKIEYLSEKILDVVQGHPKVHLVAAPDLVVRACYEVIHADMRQEEEIDLEVEELLQQHRGEIEGMEMDISMLRAKMKREVAKKRGFTL